MQGILPALLYAAEIFHITHGHVQTFQRASVQTKLCGIFFIGTFLYDYGVKHNKEDGVGMVQLC